MENELEKMLTTEEVAKILNCCNRTILRRLNQKNPEKRLNGSKTGGEWRISKADLQEYIDRTSNKN